MSREPVRKFLKLAVNKGFYEVPGGYGVDIYFGPNPDYRLEEIYFDPKFWRSLGVALGWHNNEWKNRAIYFFEYILDDEPDKFWELLSKELPGT
jgi:hypothetical protein